MAFMPTMRVSWSKSGNLQLDLLDAPTVLKVAPPSVRCGANTELGGALFVSIHQTTCLGYTSPCGP
jgi:hypothetical protein